MSTAMRWLAASAALLSTGCHGCDETDRQAPLPAPPSAPASAPEASAQPWVPLAEHVRAARAGGDVVYRAPTDEQREAFGSWVGAVARAAWTDRLPRQRPPKGFVGRLAESGRIWLLREDARKKHGCGLLALRPSSGAKVLIEAPHTYFEPGTLELALAAFEVLEAKALLVNTFHRGGSGSKEERRKQALSGKSEMDAAHSRQTCFAEAHHALLAVDADLVTVQFHGFSDQRAPGVSVVVSPSRTKADATRVAEALRPVVGADKVRVFPKEISVLGGTTNVEARLSRKASSTFLHVEMARSFRNEIKGDPALARRFVEALAEGIRTSPQ